MSLQGRSRNAAGRVLAGVAFAAVLVFTALGLSQCRLSPDAAVSQQELGVTHANTGALRCILGCYFTAARELDEEFDLHRANVKACKKDPVCLDQEEQRHLARLHEIADELKACLADCHHQGGGTAR